MKLYELVIVLHPSLSTEDSNGLIDKVEALFVGGIKQKDDIGYQTVYDVHWIPRGWKAYFISYLLEIDPKLLPDIRAKLKLMKGLVRTLFLSRVAKNPFHKFIELNDLFSERVAAIVAKDKKWNKSRTKGPVSDKQMAEVKDLEIVIEDDDSEDKIAE